MADYAERIAAPQQPVFRKQDPERESVAQDYSAEHEGLSRQNPNLRRFALHGGKGGPGNLQARLQVGSSHDPAEAQADSVAKKVVGGESMGASKSVSKGSSLAATVSRKSTSPGGGWGIMQPKCATCSNEKLLRRSFGEPFGPTSSQDGFAKQLAESKGPPRGHLQGFVLDEAIQQKLDKQKGKGQELHPPMRKHMERSFGADFSKVRIHKSSESHQLNRFIGAKAFTHGRDVYFGQGEFAPETDKGKELLAHELTHTIQQGVAEPVEQPATALETVPRDPKAAAKPQGKPVTPAAQAQVEAQKSKAEQEAKRKDEEKTQAELANNAPLEPLRASLPPVPQDSAAAETPATAQVAQTTPPAPKAEKGKTQAPALAAPQGKSPADPIAAKVKPDALQALVKDQAAGHDGGGVAEIPVPKLDANSGVDVMKSVASLPPTQQILALGQTSSVLNEAQNKERTEAHTLLPILEQPTGLGRTEGETPDPEKPPKEDAKDLKHGGEGSKLPKPDITYTAPKAPVPGSDIPKVPEKEVLSFWSFGNLLASLPTSDPDLDTSMGPRPPVDMTGDADPQQNVEMQNQADGQMNEAQLTANSAIVQDFGENDMYPTIEPEMLGVEGEFGPPPVYVPEQQLEMPALTSEMVSVWDPELQKMHQAEFDDNSNKAQTAKDDYDTQSQVEYETGMEKIETETQNTRQLQLDAQQKGRDDVNEQRTKWQEENEDVRSKYSEDSKLERERVSTEIDTKVTKANEEVETKCKDAEAEAEAEQTKSEAEAAKERKDAEEKRKNRSWWEKVGDAIGDFFNALKELVTKIFDALRAAVKAIVEFAKKAVAAIIDAVRDIVVGFIKAFAEVLKGFVKLALAAFPELRDKFIAYIDKAVEVTVKAIDALAEGLKTVVNMYLDFLGDVWNVLLDVAQGLVMLSIMLNELIITGNCELLEGIANLANSASMMTGEMFWDAVFAEMTGQDASVPLPDLEWKDQAEKDAGIAARADEIAAANHFDTEATADPSTVAAAEPVTGIEMDSIPQEELDPALMAELADMRDGEEKPLEGASSPITMRELAAGEVIEEGGGHAEQAGGPEGGGTLVEGLTDQHGNNPFEKTDQEKLDEMIANMKPNCDEKSEGAGDSGPMPAEGKVGPLSTSMRRQFIVDQLTTGLSNWWSCNWGTVVAVLVGVLIVGVILTIVTAGGFLAVLPVIMEALAAIFLAAMLVKMEGHIKTYLELAWKGGKDGLAAGAKSLAKGLAVGAVELIFNVIFKVGGSIFAAIKAMIKGIIKGIVWMLKGAVKVVKGIVNFAIRTLKSAKVAGSYLVRKGKYVFNGLQKGFSRGAKSLRDLKSRVLGKFKFKKFKVVRKGRWFEFWGEVNPWVLLATGELQHFERKDMGAGKVGDDVIVGGKKGIVVGSHIDDVGGGSKFVDELLTQADDIDALKSQFDELASSGDRRKLIYGQSDPKWLSQASENVQNTFKQRGKLNNVIKPAAGENAHHAIPVEALGKSKSLSNAVEEGFEFNSRTNGIALKRYSSQTRTQGKNVIADLSGVHASHGTYTDEVVKMFEKFELRMAGRIGPGQSRSFAESLSGKLIGKLDDLCRVKGLKVNDLFDVSKGGVDPNALFKEVFEDFAKKAL